MNHGTNVIILDDIWENRVKNKHQANIIKNGLATIVDGPDMDGDYKLKNIYGQIVGGEEWIPFQENELRVYSVCKKPLNISNEKQIAVIMLKNIVYRLFIEIL